MTIQLLILDLNQELGSGLGDAKPSFGANNVSSKYLEAKCITGSLLIVDGALGLMSSFPGNFSSRCVRDSTPNAFSYLPITEAYKIMAG